MRRPFAAEKAEKVASVVMPSEKGPRRLVAFKAAIGDILAVVSGTGDGSRVPVRVHDACLTGEVFGSLKCDCGPQLQQTLDAQAQDGLGVLIYMPQEGRGIGLANKMAAYYLQEEHGLDTVDANLALGLPAENRDYSAVGAVLDGLGISSILLMTNNPYKVERLREAGVKVEGTIPVMVEATANVTAKYLETKRRRMGHMLPKQLADAVSGFGVPKSMPSPLKAGSASAASQPSSKSESLQVGSAGASSQSSSQSQSLQASARALVEEVRREAAAHNGHRPFALLSFATSMDGFIAGARRLPDGSEERYAVALSAPASMTLTHHLRGALDGILVGVGTVLTDNPRLNVRVDEAGPSPRPLVVDSDLRTPVGCKLLASSVIGGRPQTVVLCTDVRLEGEKAARREALEAAGALVVPCPADDAGRVCLRAAFQQLPEIGVRSLMIEGGAEVIGCLLAAGQELVDMAIVTQAGVVLGSGVPWARPGAAQLERVRTLSLGSDAVFVGRPVR